MIVKFTEDQFDLFKTLGTEIKRSDGNSYYYFHHWVKQNGDSNEVELLSFEKLPDELIDEINQRRDKISLQIARESVEKFCSYDVENDDIIDVLNRQGLNGLSHAAMVNNAVTIYITDSWTKDSESRVKEICNDFCFQWFNIDCQEGIEKVFTT